MERVLVVDDDVELCDLIAEYLRPEGFEVQAVHDGETGLERALAGDTDLVVLDMMLPGISGLDVLRKVRERSRIPVLILTARGQDVDRIVGLEIGADDYLGKPFNPRELLARIRAILRRTKAAPGTGEQKRLSVGDVEIDLGARTVRKDGEAVELTSLEFNLLEKLLGEAGEVVTREEIAQEILGRRFVAYDRSIDMHVSKLRRKLGRYPDGEERIKSIRGVGYVYAKPTTEPAR